MEGITRDLEAMAEVGIGGVQAFSAYMDMPHGPADYLSPLWIELMQHAASECLRLGLEFDMHNCMGWSSSGGSWILPELSMQQVVWSEAFIQGGRTVTLQLKQPYKRMDYYKDAIVIAFPSILGANGPEQQKAEITLNGNDVDPETVTGFDLSKGIDVHSTNPSKPSLLVFGFNQPVEVASVTINASTIKKSAIGNSIIIEGSDDGRTYEKLSELNNILGNVEIPATIGFTRTKAKYFRLVIPMEMKLANVSLSASDGINDWPQKANYPNTGYHPQIELHLPGSEEESSSAAINPSDVTDITQFMDDQGILKWEAPDGFWTIIRFGHTTTGMKNRPASGNGEGLECDKFSREALDYHFNYLMDKLLPAIKPLAEKGQLGMLIDSYEVNLQNWTKNMPQEFEKRRGYALIKFLPVFTGRVVRGINSSERFLWDFRRTCADLMAENYQDRFVELCHENNIISSTEPYNKGPFDEMRAGEKMDVNLGEFWLKTGHFSHSIKVAASIQNMNGKQIVGAEAFTGRPLYSKWQEYPFSMKAQGDFMFTMGLNRFIFHRYAHQPHPNAVPGMTMGQWGFHFERTNTWFYQGKKWLEYTSRCQHMLQQGIFVGDVMCFTGEEAPCDDITMGALSPDLPAGYDFQFANRDILLNNVSIKNGRITLPDGMSFGLLLMPQKNFTTIELARKLKDLVAQGMILVGPRPDIVPSLSDYPNAEKELRVIVEELWGVGNDIDISRNFGMGRVFANMPITQVLHELEIKPDFEFTSKSGDAPIHYIHRKLKDGHAYFIANRRRFNEDLVCSFRISGYEPELWDADSGEKIPVKLYEESNGRTTLPLHLAPGGSIFVVFRSPASTRRLISIAQNGTTIIGAKTLVENTQKNLKQLTNNFSVSLWVKPETDELMPEIPGPFTETTRHTSSYPIFAPSGKQLFGEGHASFVLLAARNGVVVFEKEDENLIAVLMAIMPISSWTHFTVVYEDGKPSLYVNGEFIKEGKKSEKTIHPVIGKYYKNDKLFYYDGDLTTPEVFDYPLSSSKVKEIFDLGIPLSQNFPVVEPFQGNSPALLFWQNGNFTLKDASDKISELEVKGIKKPIELKGKWTVNFQEERGAPDKVVLEELASLHTHPDNGVKYFSGTATYHKKFNADESLFADHKRSFLDLGRIAVIAEVFLNNKNLGIVWKPPYRIDVTDFVLAGENDLQVKVTNLWPNRLIGDEHLPVENEFREFGPNGCGIVDFPDWYKQGMPKPGGGRVTFSTWRHFDKDAPLLESGLIGPVVICNAIVKPVEP
jgi:hypothetical protein